MYMSIVHDSLKCYRTVNKQTHPFKVDGLIINISMAISDASTRIPNTQCVHLSVLANVKNF